MYDQQEQEEETWNVHEGKKKGKHEREKATPTIRLTAPGPNRILKPFVTNRNGSIRGSITGIPEALSSLVRQSCRGEAVHQYEKEEVERGLMDTIDTHAGRLLHFHPLWIAPISCSSLPTSCGSNPAAMPRTDSAARTQASPLPTRPTSIDWRTSRWTSGRPWRAAPCVLRTGPASSRASTPAARAW
jgi:hypothetical protein